MTENKSIMDCRNSVPKKMTNGLKGIMLSMNVLITFQTRYKKYVIP